MRQRRNLQNPVRGRTPAPGKGGLEGRCARARHFRNSVAPLIVLAGKGKGRGGSPLDSFFFFDKFCVCTKFIKKHSPAIKTPDLR